MPHTNPYDLTDADCVLALHKIDSSLNIELDDWECNFVESNLSRNRFSEKQREIIAKLIDNHHVHYK